ASSGAAGLAADDGVRPAAGADSTGGDGADAADGDESSDARPAELSVPGEGFADGSVPGNIALASATGEAAAESATGGWARPGAGVAVAGSGVAWRAAGTSGTRLPIVV